MLPLEVQLPSLRIAINKELTIEKNAKLRLEELESFEGHHLHAQQNLEIYYSRMIQAHKKLVRPRRFKVGDLVLVLRKPMLPTDALEESLNQHGKDLSSLKKSFKVEHTN